MTITPDEDAAATTLEKLIGHYFEEGDVVHYGDRISRRYVVQSAHEDDTYFIIRESKRGPGFLASGRNLTLASTKP